MAANAWIRSEEGDDSIFGRRKRMVLSLVTVSVLLHGVAALLAGLWIIAKIFMPPPQVLEVKREIRIPAQEREHRMNMAEFDGMTGKPAFTDKLASIRPAAISLPDLPKIPTEQILPMEPGERISDLANRFTGTMDTWGNSNGIGGLGGKGNGVRFFGIESTGKRILLLFDVSTSVVNKATKARVPLSKIKEETIRLLNELPINARFGLVQFTQNYKPFNPELIPANSGNKNTAKNWVETEWVERGMMATGKKVISNADGFTGVLQVALKMEPDILFVVSDGDFQWRRTGSIANIDLSEIASLLDNYAKSGKKLTFHFIGFEMKPLHRASLDAITRKTGGTLKEIR